MAFRGGFLAVACLVALAGCAGAASVRSTGPLAGRQAAAPLYVMDPPKPWPLTKDTSTEEVVPGLEPTDGFSINATTPNLEPFAPLIEMAQPTIGPVMAAVTAALGLPERRPMLPGHDLKNKTSQTWLLPNAQAMLRLPVQLSHTAAFGGANATVGDALAASNPDALKKVTAQLRDNMVMTRMVPYQYLNNLTKLTTKLGNPVSVEVRPDGSKWFVSGGSEARITAPDYGHQFVPYVFLTVDSFLIPPSFKL